MKKFLFTAVVVGSFLLVGAGAVLADYIEPLSLTNEWDPDDVLFDASGDEIKQLQQITATPFNSLTDTFSSGLLEIYTYQAGTGGNAGIGYKYGISILGTDPTVTSGNTNDPYKAIAISSTFFDTSSRILSVNYIINYQNKAFYFDKSELTVNWDQFVTEDNGTCTENCDGGDGYGQIDDVTPTPEPATMLLFGTGLVGAAGVVRRRKKSQA